MQEEKRKLRVRKLSPEERIAIIEIHQNGILKQAQLAKMFDVSQGRISQIVNDYYNENGRLYAESD